MSSTSSDASPKADPGNTQEGASTRLLISTTTAAASGFIAQATSWRLPEFFSVRYRAAAGVVMPVETAQSQVAKALLSRISHLIPPASSDDHAYTATGVRFDWSGLSDSNICIEVVCPTSEVCEDVRREIKEICVTEDNGSSKTFELDSWGEHLPFDVLPFDVLAPQVRLADFQHFKKVLEKDLMPLGTLTASLSTMYTMCKVQDLDLRVHKVFRGYVKLSTSSMQLDLEDLLKREVKLLHWDGLPPIMYAHRHLQCYKDWVLQDVARAALHEGSNTASSSHDPGEANGSAEATSKKRKTGGE